MGDGAPRRTSWRVLPGEGALQDVLEQLSLAEKRVLLSTSRHNRDAVIAAPTFGSAWYGQRLVARSFASFTAYHGWMARVAEAMQDVRARHLRQALTWLAGATTQGPAFVAARDFARRRALQLGFRGLGAERRDGPQSPKAHRRQVLLRNAFETMRI